VLVHRMCGPASIKRGGGGGGNSFVNTRIQLYERVTFVDVTKNSNKIRL
jgi:hypothetical protein